MLPSFTDFESQTRLNMDMLRPLFMFVNEIIRSCRSHFPGAAHWIFEGESSMFVHETQVSYGKRLQHESG